MNASSVMSDHPSGRRTVVLRDGIVWPAPS